MINIKYLHAKDTVKRKFRSSCSILHRRC